MLRVAAAVAAAAAADFDQWAASQQRSYASAAERAQRAAVYAENAQMAAEHNARPEAGWTMGLNAFADMTWDEFSATRLTAPQDCSATGRRAVRPAGAAPAPSARDWRNASVVTPVKNQGSCGSCWSFSTTGALESHTAIKRGVPPVPLSEQQLVDCSDAFGNMGCGGGLPSQAFEYIHYAGGLDTEAAYPYTGKTGKTCKFDTSAAAATASGVFNITANDEASLTNAVGTVGPVSIAYDCTNGFQLYKSGIYDGGKGMFRCKQSPSKVNHAVLAVGYGRDAAKGKDYWIVKNSWGASFGMDGYFMIERGENLCGLADCASYPIV